MAKITYVEIRMVDLVPMVERTDAIQSFVSQETPIVTITDADGAVGVGYSYTIGTGGSAVISLLSETLVPRLIGREAEEIEAIWRALLFVTHATAVGAITSLALAAIDTALWDLRCKRAALPLWRMAGGGRSLRFRFTPPKAAGCTLKPQRWSRMPSPSKNRALPDQKSRSANPVWSKTGRDCPQSGRQWVMVSA